MIIMYDNSQDKQFNEIKFQEKIMSNILQMPLPFENVFEDRGQTIAQSYDNTELGTFKDNLKEPIHKWFKF